MNVQEYLQTQLVELQNRPSIEKPGGQEELIESILKYTMSKKFRKYSVAPEVLEHIHTSIRHNVEKNEPIKFTLPFGGFKLWRLAETPEADWAELFAMMYCTKWLAPICAVYKPGVWFDFFSDEIIVSRLNNIRQEDLDAYHASFVQLLEYIKLYQPSNLSMTLNRVRDQYENQAAFDADLETQIIALKSETEDKLPKLNESMRATIELNVKTSPEQESDPQWREKVQFLLDAYGKVSGRRPYYRDPKQNKIMVVCTPLWSMLAIGSTKDSTMKFWVGAGVLKPKNDGYRQLVLSPNQLIKTKLTIETINIPELTEKNFQSIKVIHE